MKIKWWFLSLLFLLAAACTSSPQVKPDAYVDLTDLQPLPTPSTGQTPLRVAVAAVISPQGTIDSYSALINYLGEKTGRPVELVQRHTYLEINDLVESGDVDLAFVCTSAYIAGQKSFGMELLAAPQLDNETVYHAYLIVPADSRAHDIADLKGKVFAFTDPISLTGRVYPTSLIQQLGSKPESFFSRTFFTHSHDEAIYAVANHLADGASVDSMVYDYALVRDPDLGQRTRIIDISPDFGIPPVVVNPHIRPQVKAQLSDILLSMQDNSKGQAALKAIGIDKFVTIEDSAYDSARSLSENIPLPPGSP
jgi:phosphonate transport system substrate-binding protein